MSRSVNQPIAWVSAVVLSLMVFGAGYGVFTMVAHADNSSDGDASASHGEHGSSAGHDDHGKAESSHDSHGEKSDAHADAGHGEKPASNEHGEHGAAAEKPAAHGEHDEHSEKSDGHGDKKGEVKEEEISSEHFKEKASEHH